MIETPELDKQAEIIKSGKAGLIQEFYDWLTQTKGYQLAQEPIDDSYPSWTLAAVWIDPEKLMAEFFGVDLSKIESERRAILASLRS